MSFAEVEIKDYLLDIDKWNPRGETDAEPFLYIDLSSVDKNEKTIVPELVSLVEPATAPSRARQVVLKDDVLVATVRPNLNGVALVSDEFDGATASTGYCVLRPDITQLDNKYLYYWVRGTQFVQEMVRQSTGANYPAVTDKVIKSSRIPLPPLKVQKHIATVLDQADQLRRQAQQMEIELNQLAQSVFLDMFGDPVTNPKGWPLKEIGIVGHVTTGNTPSRKKAEYYGDAVEWIKSDNINTPRHFLTEAQEYLSEEGRAVGRIVNKGSVLITCIAGSPACIGNVAIADRTVAFNQQINAVTPNYSIMTTEYFYALCLVGKEVIQRASTNSMKGMVSKGKLEQVKIPVPTKSLQDKYSTFFQSYVAQDKNYAKLTQEMDALLSTFTQKAFKGELELPETSTDITLQQDSHEQLCVSNGLA